ncbi:hypothetical protein HMSSN036_83870 [Paenibacillus macerans]|nr:hypothetical protein HMSSN036_83870 [Paenibacillus macerans]
MTLLFWFVNWSIQKSKQQIHAGNPEQSVRQNAAFRRRWSLFTILSSLALVFMFSFIQVNMIHPLDTNIVTLVSLIVPVLPCCLRWCCLLQRAKAEAGWKDRPKLRRPRR